MEARIRSIGIGCMCGILFASLFSVGIFSALFLCLIGVIIFIFYSKKTLFFLFFCGISLGIMRFDISEIPHPELLPAVGHKATIYAVIDEEPDTRENSIRLIVVPKKIMVHEEYIIPSGNTRILVVLPYHPEEFSYGDTLKLEGQLKTPENFETESGRVFQYKKFLEKDRIGFEIIFPKIERLGTGGGNRIKQTLFEAKKTFLKNIYNTLPEPESSLLSGILLGAKESLGKTALDNFRASGLIHIVVLSGYNVMIVAEAILRASTFLPRVVGFLLASFSILAFAIITGAGATVVRASFMALLALIARATGRVNETLRALYFAGFVMVFWNPKILVFDPSFQLSFLATLGLILFSPHIEKRLVFIPKTPVDFRSIVSATLATQFAVLPLLLSLTGVLSLVSVPANLLVLPIIPAVMFLGFLVGVCAFINPSITLIFSVPTYILLAFIFFVSERSATIPLATLALPPVSSWLILSLTLLIAFWTVKKKVRSMK